MTIDLSGQVAIVTGAGNGLGRSHALLLAKRGAKVVVNDLGGWIDGTGHSLDAAQNVAAEIRAHGGEAMANGTSVTDYEGIKAMVDETVGRWGRVDILVNNAGFMRDNSFAKLDLADFRAVLEVHLMGTVHCTKAVWGHMIERNYGRIVMTTSAAGLFGTFDQAHYAAAKMGTVGLMQVLAIEGADHDIRVNCLGPFADTRMAQGRLPADLVDSLVPDLVSPAVLALVANDAPTRSILCAGAGGVEQAFVTLTRGIHVGDTMDAAEQILARLGEIGDPATMIIPQHAGAQVEIELQKAGFL